jgi:formylmethanofuran dehydrogenase subunit E
MLSALTEALFIVESVKETQPPSMRPHDFNTVICTECGEVTVERYARIKQGKIVCIPCSEKS